MHSPDTLNFGLFSSSVECACGIDGLLLVPVDCGTKSLYPRTSAVCLLWFSKLRANSAEQQHCFHREQLRIYCARCASASDALPVCKVKCSQARFCTSTGTFSITVTVASASKLTARMGRSDARTAALPFDDSAMARSVPQRHSHLQNLVHLRCLPVDDIVLPYART